MSGWIGVDFDGTIAYYDGWKGPTELGDPIPAMIARVKQWLAEGREVRIFTARVGACGLANKDGTADDQTFAAQQRAAIEKWCEKHVGIALPVTATKDFGMVELWDDRAVQVQPNTGNPIAEFWRHVA